MTDNATITALRAVDKPSELEQLATDFNTIRTDLIEAQDRRATAMKKIAEYQRVIDKADESIATFEARLETYRKRIDAELVK